MQHVWEFYAITKPPESKTINKFLTTKSGRISKATSQIVRELNSSMGVNVTDLESLYVKQRR